METNFPSITLITPSLNRAGMIGRALDSVRAEGYPRLRHVVVDGASTDGTLDLLRQRGDIHLVVEKDRNLYDALNRGLEGELGDIVGFLNTDDRLAPGALGIVARLFMEAPEAEIVTGAIAIEFDDARGTIVIDDPRFLPLTTGNLVNGPTLTNSRFMRRALVRRIGRFDIRFPVVSDRDFLLRAHYAARAEMVTREVLYHYRSHVQSLTMATDRPSPDLAEALRFAAATRARETAGTPIGRAYARWAAWAQFYEGILDFRTKPSLRAARNILAAPSWSVSGLARQLVRTLVDRRARRGRRIEASPDSPTVGRSVGG